jgi:hypothetical protein
MKEQTHITLNSGRKVTAFEYGLMETLGFDTKRMVSTMTPLEDVTLPVEVEDTPPVVVNEPVAQPKTGLIHKFSRFFRR